MKTLIALTHKPHYTLILSIIFGMGLLFIRIQITNSLFFSFLVWNLFLAGIPYIISQVLRYSSWLSNSKFWRFIGFGSWLLFFPNSPYIITDLIHLHHENAELLWLDLFLIFIFAMNGLILGILSLLDIYHLMALKYNIKTAHYIILHCCILCGYGIYIGRFLRFNSWDIISQPKNLVLEIGHSFYNPHVGLVTFFFGGFVWILFLVLKSIEVRLSTKEEMA